MPLPRTSHRAQGLGVALPPLHIGRPAPWPRGSPPRCHLLWLCRFPCVSTSPLALLPFSPERSAIAATSLPIAGCAAAVREDRPRAPPPNTAPARPRRRTNVRWRPPRAPASEGTPTQRHRRRPSTAGASTIAAPSAIAAVHCSSRAASAAANRQRGDAPRPSASPAPRPLDRHAETSRHADGGSPPTVQRDAGDDERITHEHALLIRAP